MPTIPFESKQYLKTINHHSNNDGEFDIHELIANGLKIGLNYTEIRQMETFSQIYNILVSYFEEKEKTPTQAEIDLIT